MNNLNIEKHIFKESSTILRTDYDHFMSVLGIYFKNGTFYQFIAVPHSLYEEFIKAESAGKFFQTNIKNKFEFLKK